MHQSKHAYMYIMLFYSHLTYGCNVWGLTSNKNLNEIEILQSIRIITDSDFRSPLSNHLFIRHKILKVHEILDLNQLQLAFNFLDKSLASNLNNLFKSNDEIHNYHTRFNFYIPSVDTSIYGINSIKFHCPNLWNKTWVNGITIDNDRRKNIRLNQIHNVY